MTAEEKKEYLEAKAKRKAEREKKRKEKYGDKYDEMKKKNKEWVQRMTSSIVYIVTSSASGL